MKACRIVGCRWTPAKGETVCPIHNLEAIKLHEHGFIYYAASWGPRYCDPVETYVSLLPGVAERLAQSAADLEKTEAFLACDDPDCDGTCCLRDIVTWGEHTHRAKDLFSAAELKEQRRALLQGNAVCLGR